MKHLSQTIHKKLLRAKENGLLAVCYALLAEALLLGYLGFIGLFTIETLLPTFVTARFSLTKMLSALVFFSFFLAALGRFLHLSFPFSFNKKSPLFSFGLLLAIALLSVSLFKFPPIIIFLLIGGFFLAGYLLQKTPVKY
ncbi:MAG: hypothetical protein HYV45_01570 [Candidatus Moranbacteria bacterium]|nr:hypothetical protein [Candidatus Moranbacteria bacterium]